MADKIWEWPGDEAIMLVQPIWTPDPREEGSGE